MGNLFQVRRLLSNVSSWRETTCCSDRRMPAIRKNGPISDAARGRSLDPKRTSDRLDLCRKIAYARVESFGG